MNTSDRIAALTAACGIDTPQDKAAILQVARHLHDAFMDAITQTAAALDNAGMPCPSRANYIVAVAALIEMEAALGAAASLKQKGL